VPLLLAGKKKRRLCWHNRKRKTKRGGQLVLEKPGGELLSEGKNTFFRKRKRKGGDHDLRNFFLLKTKVPHNGETDGAAVQKVNRKGPSPGDGETINANDEE